MTDIVKCIESLRAKLDRHRQSGLKEYPTRTIFIDPLLCALGWDVHDPDQVELEYPTVDGKSVDYAMKLNRKPVLLLEAKQLNDTLDDVKSITQVVGYATSDGIEWCALTNGVRYKLYKASERASAPDKLLFEVSIDPRDSGELPVEDTAAQLWRLSRDSLAQGALDGLATEVFTSGKVRKALDQLFIDAPQPLIRLIRKVIDDTSVTRSQIQQALAQIWRGENGPAIERVERPEIPKVQGAEARKAVEYPETHHTEGKPPEVVELYRALDRLCQSLAPGGCRRAFKQQCVNWSLDKAIFCSAHLQQNGLRVWVKTDPRALDPSKPFARDVSRIGHWGCGDVELAIQSLDQLREAEEFVRLSFDGQSHKQR